MLEKRALFGMLKKQVDPQVGWTNEINRPENVDRVNQLMESYARSNFPHADQTHPLSNLAESEWEVAYAHAMNDPYFRAIHDAHFGTQKAACLSRNAIRGSADALRRFGFAKEAEAVAAMPHLELGPAGASHVPPAAPAGASSLLGRARNFGAGQMGAAKDLFGNLRAGLGGAATPEAGAAARGAALGNLKTLAPSLAAGGGLYLLHRHHQAQEEEAKRRAMMMQGGYGA